MSSVPFTFYRFHPEDRIPLPEYFLDKLRRFRVCDQRRTGLRKLHLIRSEVVINIEVSSETHTWLKVVIQCDGRI